jgi:hypothetical protein
MSALDFFLYDNQTWSPRWGRDWGLKAATGVLAARADLKVDFDRYCGAAPNEQGQLSGFGEAIGGLRPRTGNGYLLCVTLETPDFLGRPSWAVCGLWCPDSATLETALSSGDPIGSARTLLGVGTLPDALEIRPAKLGSSPRRRRQSLARPAFHGFDPSSTVREVVAILLGALQSRTPLPNVLGITAASRLEATARQGFDLVYCRPMEERAERALARVLSPPEPDEDAQEPSRPPGGPPAGGPPRSRPNRHPRSRPLFWLPWAAAGVLCAAMAFLLVSDDQRQVPAVLHHPPPKHREATPLVPATPNRRGSSAEAALGRLGELLEECRSLTPDKLRHSPGFRVAETLEVLSKHKVERDRVRQAYSALLEIRDRMVKRQQGKSYVAYYFDEAGKSSATDLKLQKIGAILEEAPLGNEDCRVLKKAFGFEFENEGSTVRRWCDTLERLEQVDRELVAFREADAAPPGHPEDRRPVLPTGLTRPTPPPPAGWRR